MLRGGPFYIQGGGALYFIGSQIICLCSYESQIIFFWIILKPDIFFGWISEPDIFCVYVL